MPKCFLTEQDRLNNKLAAWVYGELKTQHITQEELATKRGISQQAISNKLRKKKFDFEDLVCFIKVFNPDIKEIERLIGR